MTRLRYKRPTPTWRKVLIIISAVIIIGIFAVLVVGLVRDNADGDAPPGVPDPPGRTGTPVKELNVGDRVDELDGVAVYYNGKVSNVVGRNTAPDGYNIGLQYQCVEFVKRYYYEALNHKMPDPWGHATDFFNPALADGALNAKRALTQHANGGKSKPQKGDLLVFGPTLTNKYGHVAIVSKVEDDVLELIQQNPGPRSPSREKRALIHNPADNTWLVDDPRLLGWLRKQG